MDLGKLAVEVYDESKVEGSRQVRWLLKKLYDQAEDSGESDLLSHLLFDTGYTSAAEALGFSDAQRMESELLEFFNAEKYPVMKNCHLMFKPTVLSVLTDPINNVIHVFGTSRRIPCTHDGKGNPATILVLINTCKICTAVLVKPVLRVENSTRPAVLLVVT